MSRNGASVRRALQRWSRRFALRIHGGDAVAAQVESCEARTLYSADPLPVDIAATEDTAAVDIRMVTPSGITPATNVPVANLSESAFSPAPDAPVLDLATAASTVVVSSSPDVFLQGNYLEVGLNDNGVLGSTVPAPFGFVRSGSTLGVIADPARDGWAAYNGDFVTPGTPLDEWGVSVAGTVLRNNNTLNDIAGVAGPMQDDGVRQSITWTGSTASLAIDQTYTVGRDALFVDVAVTLTNTTGGTLTDIYFYRNVDPDNNYNTNGIFDTTNTVVSQGDATGVALVRATQPDGSEMGLQANDTRARVAWGSFSSVVPEDAWNGINGHSTAGSQTADESITLVFHIPSLAAGASTSLSMRYFFASNVAPDITSSGGGANAAVTVAENQTAAVTMTAVDPDGGATAWSITGGADAARFTINNSTGALSFVSAPDYEAPADVGGNNVYDVIVQASDGNGGVDTQSIAVTVSNVNDPPVITSNGGGASAARSVAENQTAVTTVTSTDVDGGVPVYSISGGADAGLFTINASSGVLTFVTAPNFEAPADAGGDNVYDVTVQVSDGNGGTDTQAIAVTVTNVNEAPVITSDGGGASATLSVAEHQTAVTTVTSTDVDGGAPVYSISGGPDAALFTINASSGVLTFVTAPNFDAPTDAGGDNVYDVTVQVSDGNGGSDTQSIAVTITDVNDPPVITSNGGGMSAALTVAENQTAVTTVTSTDVDGGVPVYSISGGADAALFAINASSGVLTFVTAPNFEAPTDAGGNNVYDVTVQVSDGNGGTDTQAIAVTVTNVNEAPVISSNGGGAGATLSVAENQTAVTTVTSTDVDGGAPVYSITGGADAALFTINASSGVLTFVTAPNFEAPTDAGGNNVYDVTVQVSDGNGGTDTQAIAVTVTNVNEAPAISSNGGGSSAALSVAENQTAVTTVTSTDVDGGVPVYSISGSADAALFAINASSGVLTFVTAPNFEVPTDAGGDNVYDVTVQVSDGNGGTDTQAIAVTVTNVNEAPVIASDGGGVSAALSVAENQTAVTTVTSTDVDGGVPVYSISGGADAAVFTINASSGVLTFVTSPNFEVPTDAGGDNVYDVTVQVSDGNGGTDTQAIAITVTNVNEAPVITSDGGGPTATVTVAENQTSTTTVTSGDVDGGAPAYSIVGGADASLLVINATTGVLTFNTPPDFESPADTNADNVYNVIVQVDDGLGGSDTQTIDVTVTNVNEPPAITSNGGGSTAALAVNENQTAITTVTSADVDGGAPAYSIAGGADAGLFTIDPVTGVLAFVAPPDREAPTDAGADNVYDVIVQVSDGNGGTDTQTLAIAVNNVNEGPLITSGGGGASASIAASENQTAVTIVTATDVDGDTLSFSIAGGADAAAFRIDAATGVLTFVASPDFERPADADRDGAFDLIIAVDDGFGGNASQALDVRVTDANDAPVITSFGGRAAVTLQHVEREAVAGAATATDEDRPQQTLAWSIAGGADAQAFTIDAATGTFSFRAPPELRAPADANHDNVYEVVIAATDPAGASVTQRFAITIVPMAAPPDSQPGLTPAGQDRPLGTATAAALRDPDPPAPPQPAALALKSAATQTRVADVSQSIVERLLDLGTGDATTVTRTVTARQRAAANTPGQIAALPVEWDTPEPTAVPGQLWLNLGIPRGHVVGIGDGLDDMAGSSRPGVHDRVRRFVQDPVHLAGTAFSAGLVWWVTRAGGLLSSVAAGIPAWRHVDLMPVLARDTDEDAGDWYLPDPDGPDASTDEDDAAIDRLFETPAMAPTTILRD